MNNQSDPIAQSVNNAARMTGVSRASLYRAASEGRITFRKIGGRTVILTEELRRFVEAAPVSIATKPVATSA